MTRLYPTHERCICGHGPWSHSLIAFRPAEGQLLDTTGICSMGNCHCQTYERQLERALPPRRPRRLPPPGHSWKIEP